MSRFVPSSAIWLDSREMLDVSSNSFVERDSDSRVNSGSSLYVASSCRRVVVGCDSRDDKRSKDMSGSGGAQQCFEYG